MKWAPVTQSFYEYRMPRDRCAYSYVLHKYSSMIIAKSRTVCYSYTYAHSAVVAFGRGPQTNLHDYT